MDSGSKIFVAGHRGMVGSAILRHLHLKGYHNLVLRNSRELDLRDHQATANFFSEEKPEYVFLAAAKVGGIEANNTYRAEFLYDNLMIQNNIIHQSYIHDVKKLLFLGSSCIYPKHSPQPIKEEYLLSGKLEETNEPYAIAKIAGIKMCDAYRDQYGCNFISAMPANLYGPNDNYDLKTAHVLPALLRKFYEAKIKGYNKVTVWGSGHPKREFLHVDDLAAACIFLMENYNEPGWINIGTGEDLSIKDLAQLIKVISAFEGDLEFDTSKPDGTPRKLLDNSKMNGLGWNATIPIIQGIQMVYNDFINQYSNRPILMAL